MEEPLEACPYCSHPVSQSRLDCPQCKSTIPYCIATVSARLPGCLAGWGGGSDGATVSSCLPGWLGGRGAQMAVSLRLQSPPQEVLQC